MRIYISIFLIIISVAATSLASTFGKVRPFTEEEDFDGARTVWFFMNASGIKGFKHSYTPAKYIPESNRWLMINSDKPHQLVDMAWWPTAVAIMQNEEKNLYIFKDKIVPLDELEQKFGKPVFRRFNTAEKPLALVVFKMGKGPGKVPAILPETEIYDAIFDLAINTRGLECSHNADDVWISIVDTDENRIFEIDHTGCITGEERKVDEQFFELIKTMEKGGSFD